MTINASKAHKCDGNVGHGDKKLVTAAAQWPLENSLKKELHCSSGSHFDHPTTRHCVCGLESSLNRALHSKKLSTMGPPFKLTATAGC